MENYSNEDDLGMNDQCWNVVHIKLLRLKEDVIDDVREAIQGQSHFAKYNEILRNELAKVKVDLKLDVANERIDEIDTKVLTNSENNQGTRVEEVEKKLAIFETHEIGPFTLTLNLSTDDFKL